MESDDLSCATPESIKKYNRWAFSRQSSFPASMTMKAMKSKSKAKVKLTFVNGQFVDLSTEEGQDIVKAALSEEDGTSVAVAGILSSVKSGHCSIIQGPSVSRCSSFSRALSGITDTSYNSASKYGFNDLTDSDLSNASNTSKDSMSTQGSSSNALSAALDSKNAVSSIVSLGNGHFLTASNCDRVSIHIDPREGKRIFIFLADDCCSVDILFGVSYRLSMCYRYVRPLSGYQIVESNK